MTEPSKTSVEQFPILPFFDFEHLPQPMKDVSRHFNELAYYVVMQVTVHPAEKASCLRKLLEAKDAAVRVVLPPK